MVARILEEIKVLKICLSSPTFETFRGDLTALGNFHVSVYHWHGEPSKYRIRLSVALMNRGLIVD